MDNSVVNLKNKLSLIKEHWQPKVISELNNYQFKLAKLKGDFIWHDHQETDEAFIVIDGSLIIELPDGFVELEAGELYIVPKGVKHRPVAKEEVHVLLIEPKNVLNTGDVKSERTAQNDVWI